jgi:hypothetical protein
VTLQHHGIAGQQLARTQQQLVARIHLLRRDILDLTSYHLMGDSRGRGLELPNRIGRPTFGVALERLATGLHEDDDEAGQRLVQQEGCDNGEHRHQIGSEAPGKDSANGLPDDGKTTENQARGPEESRPGGVSRE